MAVGGDADPACPGRSRSAIIAAAVKVLPVPGGPWMQSVVPSSRAGQVARPAAAASSASHQRARRRGPRSAAARRRSRSSTACEATLAALPRLRVPEDGLLDRLGAHVLVGDEAEPVGQRLSRADLELHQPGVLVHAGRSRTRAPSPATKHFRPSRSLVSCAGSKRYSRPDGLLDRPGRRRGARQAGRGSRRRRSSSSSVISWRSNIRHHIGFSSRRWNSTSQPTSSVQPRGLGSRSPTFARSSRRPASASAGGPIRVGLRRRSRLAADRGRSRCRSPAAARAASSRSAQVDSQSTWLYSRMPSRMGDCCPPPRLAAVHPPLVLDHRAAGRDAPAPVAGRQIQPLDLLQRIAGGADDEPLPHDRVQVHEHSAAGAGRPPRPRGCRTCP